jgi:hypothetical protein
MPVARATAVVPDESDLLLPPDDDGEVSVGRDQQSFLGGMPLPLAVPVEPPPPAAQQRPVVTAPPPPPQFAAEQQTAPPVAPAPAAPPRPRVFKTPFAAAPFEVAADELPAPDSEQPYVPPFAGASGGPGGRVTTAFDGLAMAPVREVDVFSHASGPAPTIPPTKRVPSAAAPADAAAPDADATTDDPWANGDELPDGGGTGAADAPLAVGPTLTNMSRGHKPVPGGFRPPVPAAGDGGAAAAARGPVK